MLPLHWAGVLSSLSHLLVQITRPPLPLPGQGIDSKVKPQSVRSSQAPSCFRSKCQEPFPLGGLLFCFGMAELLHE